MVKLFAVGEELLTAMNNPPPFLSAVFVDLNMPGKPGLEILKEIKVNDSLKDVPSTVNSR